MQVSGFALSPYLRQKLDVFAQRFWEPLIGKPTAVSLDEPGYVEAPPARPVLTFVEPPPAKPKPRRARGPRMVNGVNRAVVRAIAACKYYFHDGVTLAHAAQVCNSSVAYMLAVFHLRDTGQTALLNAALHGDVPLLTAAYKTDTATAITILDNN